MLLLNIQSSPRGAKSASIAVNNAFLDAYQALHSDVTINTLNVWEENQPDFDQEAIVAPTAATLCEAGGSRGLAVRIV